MFKFFFYFIYEIKGFILSLKLEIYCLNFDRNGLNSNGLCVCQNVDAYYMKSYLKIGAEFVCVFMFYVCK